MKDGKLDVNVESNSTTMILSGKDIESLKRFHFLLFTDIISVIKDFMLFDNDNLENSFLIVPCKCDYVLCYSSYIYIFFITYILHCFIVKKFSPYSIYLNVFT